MLSKFVSSMASNRAVGPLALAAAALGAAGALQYYDHYKLKTTRNKLYTALNEIDVINYKTQSGSEELKKEKLVKALTYIREYMHQGSDAAGGAESEDHNDRRNIVFDFGGMKKLVNILRDEELSRDSEVSVAALKALYNLIKAGPNERANIRTSFAGMGGIHLLLNMVFDESLSDEVREEAALVLRRSTYVDYYKKDFVEEVPRGSEGALTLLADGASLQRIVDMLDKTSGKMKMGLVGTITHVSHLNDGAYALSNMNVVDKLLKHIADSKQELLVASIFCIATIAIANVQPDAPKLLEKAVLSQLFKQVVGRHGSKVMKRIGDILYALCYHLTYKGIYDQEFVKEKRRIITGLMAENITGSTVQLFTLISSANAEGKYRMAKVRHLVTQKSFSPEKHSELKKLAAEADALVQKEEAKKKKAMNPFAGGEMTPEMLQAMGLM